MSEFRDLPWAAGWSLMFFLQKIIIHEDEWYEVFTNILLVVISKALSDICKEIRVLKNLLLYRENFRLSFPFELQISLDFELEDVAGFDSFGQQTERHIKDVVLSWQ